MMSARRTAQLGLGAACLTLVASITVLVADSSEPADNSALASPISESSKVTPLATGTLGNFQADLAHVAIAKQ